MGRVSSVVAKLVLVGSRNVGVLEVAVVLLLIARLLVGVVGQDGSQNGTQAQNLRKRTFRKREITVNEEDTTNHERGFHVVELFEWANSVTIEGSRAAFIRG